MERVIVTDVYLLLFLVLFHFSLDFLNVMNHINYRECFLLDVFFKFCFIYIYLHF